MHTIRIHFTLIQQRQTSGKQKNMRNIQRVFAAVCTHRLLYRLTEVRARWNTVKKVSKQIVNLCSAATAVKPRR